MKLLFFTIILILSILVIAGINFVAADNMTSTAYGGLVRLHNELASGTVSIGPLPLQSDIRQNMFYWCSTIGNDDSTIDPKILQFVQKNSPDLLSKIPDVEQTNQKIRGLYWETLQRKLISDTLEFQYLHGMTNSIIFQYAMSATSCPPITEVNGTFATTDGNGGIGKYKFDLGYNAETYQYKFAQLEPIKFTSPLKQYETGITANNIKCNQSLQLVIKAEDGSPACVKPDSVTKLVQRGWAKEIVTNMSTESSTLNKTTTNELKIDLSNQTYEAGYPVYVNLKNMNQESTCKTPSISVRDTSDQSLVFGPTPARNDTGYCADPSQITFYAGLEKNALITKPTRYSILATLDNKTYQKEFTVIPSLYSNKNITADSTQIMPGYLTFTSCLPVSDVPNNGTLINYTGFDLYRRYLAGPDTGGIPEIDDYLLKPGHTGSFVMQVHQGQFSKDANLAGGLYFLSENLLNLDNSTVWNNRPLASEAHPGLVLSYTPSFAKVGPEGYATITASISALQNAPRGTYWLHLPPGICGGDLVLLTIGEQPLAQPPDYIGYDLASHFAQGVGNPTHSDVTFELINAGIHTFENCSVNYISQNQTTTIKTFDIIPPGLEYKYHANLTSTSKINGFLECKTPPIIKVYPDVWTYIIPY